MIEITEELKDEVRTYWRDTVKDKDALARTADLFGLREEDVSRILAVRWKEKKNFWTEDRVFRLKAYMAQGMGNTEIAKQLGCKTQAVADFKRHNRDMLPAYGKERKESFEEISNSVDEGKKKEPLTWGDVKDSEKNTIVEVDSSVDNYSTDSGGCQEVVYSHPSRLTPHPSQQAVTPSPEGEGLGADNAGCDDEITAEMYNNLYTRFLEMWNKCEGISGILFDVELVLKTAKYAGTEWCNRYESYDNELGDCCRMFDMMVSQAIEVLSKALDILENGNDR